MSGKVKSLLFSAFAFLLLSLPAFGQMTSIEGSVKGLDGKPLAGATVKFDRTDIKGSYTVKTDKKGKYGHYGLPMGRYDISVVVDGKMMDQTKGIQSKFAGPQEVDFDLAKDGAQEAAASGPPDAERGMSKEEKAAFEKKNKDREAALAKNKELNDAFNAGKTALEAKQYDAAIEAFTKASTIDDKQVVVWSGLADAYVGAAGTKPAESAALYEKGFDAYKKAIELKPDDAAYYNNYAIALAKGKKLEEAKTNLDKAAQLDPAGAGKYFYNMGALLVNGGQNDAAGEQFKKAVTADPNYADAQYQYGVYLASKAQTDPSGKVIALPGTIEALQAYVSLKGAACASATATSAPPGCELVGAAKEMAAQLGGTLSTTYTNPNAPAAKGSADTKKKK
jgi:tetratricopeptide (TPR) repeat protein